MNKCQQLRAFCTPKVFGSTRNAQHFAEPFSFINDVNKKTEVKDSGLVISL